MRKLIALSIVLLCLGGMVFASGEKEGNRQGAFQKQSLNFGGSTTVLPIMESAIEAYKKLHPEVTISYAGPGSSAGIKGVLEGTYSLGGSSRTLKAEETQAGVMATTIALDGLAVMVNGKVTVNSLTLEQVAKIFAGQITNWKEVGGPDMAIVVINRDEASGTRATFQEMVLDHKLGKGTKFITSAIIVESNGDMVQKIAGTPYAIGYCGFGYIDSGKSAGAKDVIVDGVAAKLENILNKKYPLARELYVVHKGALPAGSVQQDFVKYLLSADGQKIVKASGFIPLP